MFQRLLRTTPLRIWVPSSRPHLSSTFLTIRIYRVSFISDYLNHLSGLMMNVDEVLRLIDQLYSSSSSKNEQEDADRKLQNFQLSPDAWNISLEILNRTPSTEAVYFASNTLRTKVQSNYISNDIVFLVSALWYKMRLLYFFLLIQVKRKSIDIFGTATFLADLTKGFSVITN